MIEIKIGNLAAAAGAWDYDAAGRLLAIPGFVASMVYDASGRVTRATYANNAVTTNVYSPQRGWMESYETRTGAGAKLLGGVYTRDLAGRITGVTTSSAPAADTAKDSWTYAYDVLDRLVSANNANDNTLDQSFLYATNGNLTRITTNSVASNYVYPGTIAGAQRTLPHAPASVGGQALVWDRNGNLQSGRGRTFLWDGKNRPASIAMGTATPVSFLYGPEGGRVSKLAPAA